MRTEQFFNFIVERDLVRQRKERGESKPWTKDLRLQSWRFCNVHREDDKVTKWIAQNWRDNNAGDPDLWFAMAVARWNNHPDTLAEIGYPVPWNPRKFIDVCNARKARSEKVWTGAYMIGTQGNAKNKPLFIAEDVLSSLWAKREVLRPTAGITLAKFTHRLANVLYQGKFMAGQITADAKYADPHLLEAEDWNTFAISGPGSRRGLNRLMNQPKNMSWRESKWHETLLEAQKEVNDLLWKFDRTHPEWYAIGPLDAQDVQNMLCEWDKYERLRLREGNPRAKYQGAK